MYYLASDQIIGTSIVRVVETEVAFIPMDERNQHYQAYLAWLEEGNTPEEWSPNGN
jgi:hypothetical protein